ncbi:nuclear transport factor 2 family protein [Pleomorphovibrio marinus]|uniref:nuclear transport factor 2 family protein n=1 Tax=Pleomorphovibrio marinus TaxID=2164132 RepID=UPI000E0C99DE|nr:nuclear transport factor 2 family protein [Pleomorphovibrio marinus]
MYKSFSGLILFLMLACTSHPDESSVVLDLEKQRFQAMVERDVEFLEAVISDDLHYIHSNGEVDDKASFIAPIAAGERHYDDITIAESRVRMYDNTAIINAECTYHRKHEDGSPNNLQLRYTNVYVKLDGKWKMVSWQSFKME